MKTEYGDKVNLSAGILCIIGALATAAFATIRISQEIHKKLIKSPQKIEQKQEQTSYRIMPSHCR